MTAVWAKSSLSFSNGNCVEVAELPGGSVGVRNSRDPEGPVLRFTQGEWNAFLMGARTGEFDRFGTAAPPPRTDETAPDEVPPLVMRAQAAARQAGFPLTREEAGPGRPSACLPGVGRFLAVLAAGCAGGRIGELGTGAGIGAGWIASAMPADCALITVEIDEPLARAARELLTADSRVEVITGDALRVIPSRGPFDLLFADSGVRDPADFAVLVSLLRIGGRMVMDDVTPEYRLPPDAPLRADDIKRSFFTGEPRLTWTEVVLPDLRNSLLVGTRTK